MNTPEIENFLSQGFFHSIDLHFARLVSRLSGSNDPAFFLAALLVSHATSEGNVCLDLSAAAGRPLAEKEESEDIVAPELGNWLKTLQKNKVVGRPGETKPLVLTDQARLYLYRYWEYETLLAQDIIARTKRHPPKLDHGTLQESLQRLFPGSATNGIDWQKVAAFAAARRPFCVVSGGPGTGKTSLITKILALILEQQQDPAAVRVKLAAPTGKAAARLQEAIKRMKDGLRTKKSVEDAIKPEASTIHRLLGSVPNSPYFQRDRNHPLPADVVVVDEASMVDLALMSKLTQAMQPGARLILMGDKDQLASVEAGSVLGDICGADRIHDFSKTFVRHYREVTGESLATASNARTGIQDCVIQLQKSYRFGSDSGIGDLSRAVNEGNGTGALDLLKGNGHPDIGWRSIPSPQSLANSLRTRVLEGYAPFLRAKDPSEAFQLFQNFRILCAIRRGPYGVYAMNRMVEQILKQEGLLGLGKHDYRGRALLITKNDYLLSLFNGDIGIVLPDPEAGGEMRVFFAYPDGSLRKIAQARLPEHETAFAMTVHKSQGSEFGEVLLMLPDRHAPVLTRELVYTGITRARERVEVWGTEKVFIESVRQRTQRASGLHDLLWEHNSKPALRK